MKRFNDWLGDRLAYGLSTMTAFYAVSLIVLVPLLWERPTDLVGWVQYGIQSFFQGASLPVLGYVARIAGERNERITIDTHTTVSQEQSDIKATLAELRQMHLDEQATRAEMQAAQARIEMMLQQRKGGR